MATPKEKCFRQAIDKLNEGREAKGLKKLDVAHEQGWIRDLSGKWEPSNWTRDLVYSIRKTIRILNGAQDPRESGPNPIQYRKPDVTLTRANGSKVVIDTKFTGANGKPDPWREAPGMSGTKQKEDYQDINKDQGNPIGEPKLDKDTCDCGKRKLQTETVLEEVPALDPANELYFMPQPAPGGALAPKPGALRPAPGGALGGRLIMPRFVFP